MAVIPALIPQPNRENYAATPTVPRKRIPMDDGFTLDPRRYGSQPFSYTLTWALTWDQLKAFEAFLEYQVFQKDGYFVVNIPGNPTVRPRARPAINFVEGHWNLTLPVEQMKAAPVKYLTPTILPMWPDPLPRFESEGYTYSVADAEVRSDIEAGRAETRTRFQHRVLKYSGKIRVNLAERNAFWEFYKNQLVDGIAWFSAPYESPFGPVNIRAKFSDALPTETAIGSLYEITVNLETGNAPILTQRQYNELVANDPPAPDLSLLYVEAGYVEDGYLAGGTITAPEVNDYVDLTYVEDGYIAGAGTVTPTIPSIYVESGYVNTNYVE